MSMISRQVAELREWSEHENLVEENGTMADLLFKAADTIEMLSEKVREPKQGEWISVCGNKQCDCSVCGEGFDHTYEWIERWNFCPNCGARMKGVEDGQM